MGSHINIFSDIPPSSSHGVAPWASDDEAQASAYLKLLLRYLDNSTIIIATIKFFSFIDKKNSPKRSFISFEVNA
jgi:hypothetical protein